MYEWVLRAFQASACVLPVVLLYVDAPFGRFAVESRWNWHGKRDALMQATHHGWRWSS